MDLTRFSVYSYFDSLAMSRGHGWYSRGIKVESVKWSNAVGPVWASYINGGKVIAGFQTNPDTGWEFVSNCESCRDTECQHAAALSYCIQFEKNAELSRWQNHFEAHARQFGMSYAARILPDLQTHRQDFAGWFGEQSRLSADESATNLRNASSTEPTETAIFVLSHPDSAHRSVAVVLSYSRPLKTKGQMSKMTGTEGLQDYRVRSQLRADPLLRRYVQWASTNLVGAPAHLTESSMIVDQSGMDMLRELAAERRLFGLDKESDRPVGPLTMSADRALEWTWNEDTNENWIVQPRVSAGGLFFLGTCPLFIDLENKTFGTLDLGGMTAKRVGALLSAPPIPKKWLEKNFHTTEAVRCLPRPPIEVVQRNNRIVSGIEPLPVLTVAIANKKEVFSIALSFRYGEINYFFPPGSERIQFIKLTDETIELVRDTHAEEKALKVIAGEKLTLSGNEGDLRFNGDKQAQIEGFRKLLETDFKPFRDADFSIETVEGWSEKVVETTKVEGGFGGASDDLANPSTSLNFSLGFFIDGERYNLLPLIPQLLAIIGGDEGLQTLWQMFNDGQELEDKEAKIWVVDDDGRWIGLPKVQMAPWLRTLAGLMVDRSPRELSGPSIRLSRIEALSLEANYPEVQLGSNATQVIRELLDAKATTTPISVPGFHGVLEPFQCAGFRWLTVLSNYQLGGILGDDRGLGKTVQCVAHLADLKHRGALVKPALIVVPPTQIHHWRHHIQDLAPEVNVLTMYGTERAALISSAEKFDAVLTSWDSVIRYVDELRSQRFHVGFLDETEKIHNSTTLVSKALRLLNIGYEIALNGSPLENNYGDVWSVVDAVLPGYLGSEASFKRLFRNPIEQHADVSKIKILRRRIAPFMLRRLKGESGVNLPPVIHEDVPLKIHGAQANFYEMIRLTTEASVREAMASSGIRGEPASILPILTKLRQVCCDPSLTAVGKEQGIVGSAKLDWLNPKIDELIAEGRRVLLVGFFVEFFHLIGAMLEHKGIGYSKIIGTMTPNKRELQKKEFKQGKTRVFLLGLKSGGRGTDLPEADTVIHLDPWYNPKAHDQATDRAHRMGQRNTVTNYRLFIEGSIEERVIQIQDRKRLFADSLDNEEIFDEHKITTEDILEMLKPIQQVQNPET